MIVKVWIKHCFLEILTFASAWDKGKLSHGFRTQVLETTLPYIWASKGMKARCATRSRGSTWPKFLETVPCRLQSCFGSRLTLLVRVMVGHIASWAYQHGVGCGAGVELPQASFTVHLFQLNQSSAVTPPALGVYEKAPRQGGLAFFCIISSVIIIVEANFNSKVNSQEILLGV